MRNLDALQLMVLNQTLNEIGLPTFSAGSFYMANYRLAATPRVETRAGKARICSLDLVFTVNNVNNSALFEDVWENIQHTSAKMEFNSKINAMEITYRVTRIDF